MQLVTPERKRIRLSLSASITVAQLYQHVRAITGLEHFELLSGVPPRPLRDGKVTAAEAKLANSVVTQKQVQQ